MESIEASRHPKHASRREAKHAITRLVGCHGNQIELTVC